MNLSTKPDTGPEWVIEHSGFLDNMLTTSYIKSGFPIITEHFKIIDLVPLGLPFYLPIWPRLIKKPTAVGHCAYETYNGFELLVNETWEPNNQTMMAGECDNLTIDRTHPIFKDYWGDTALSQKYSSSTLFFTKIIRL